MNSYDLIIIGGGPAGITAGIYAVRANLNVLIIDNVQSNKLSKIATIENYPGFETISGFDLSQKLNNQAKQLGIEIINDKVLQIKDKQVITANNTYQTKAIIIATGSKQRKLDLIDAEKYEGKGISYCATCDGFFFRNKKVVVIGDSDIAIEEAKYLSSLAEVTIVSRNSNNIEGFNTKTNSVPTKLIIENEKLIGITIEDLNTKQTQDIECSGIFPYISFNPSTDFVDSSILDDKGYIIVNADMSTSIPYIFAAGDCIKKDLRQIVTACADGAIAATSSIKYIKKQG